MTFQPIVPFSGYPGWTFLKRTMNAQQSAFVDSAPVQRVTSYFKDNISRISTAADLVADRQLLQVALGAFGLDEDLDNKFFIETILADGTTDPGSLANRLSDDRYRRFSEAFGFDGGNIGNTGRPGFADDIVSRYERKQFEQAVGQSDGDLRSALNLQDGLSQIVEANKSNNARWFAIMGDPPVRAVIEKALGLPSAIARIDVDQQLDAFKSRASATFGTDQVEDLLSNTTSEDLVRLFLVRSEAAKQSAAQGATIALTLLQSIPRQTVSLFP